MYRNIRPICIILSQHENTEAWTFSLVTLKAHLSAAMKEHFKDEDKFECDYFISDGGLAILNGRKQA